MSLTKQEIEAELAHKRELVNALTRRRRPLELQAAHRGLNTPPETLTEISSLSDQIRTQEEEISRLETLAAEGSLPIAEVEYRVFLAETWGTQRGQPTVVGAVRLELTRLRLGIVPERAQELEHEIRVALAQEAYQNIEVDIFEYLCKMDTDDNIPGRGSPLDIALVHIGRALRLDSETALRLLLVNLPPEHRQGLNTQFLRRPFFYANRVHRHSEEQFLFDRFLVALTAELESERKHLTRKDATRPSKAHTS